MSSELPQDLRSHFEALEQQALSLLRQGDYQLAEGMYRFMLETVVKRQEAENRRIHKGSYLHQIGFSLVLQGNLLGALESFLLAYVEDTLNVPVNQENDADGSPAARVLREGFHLRNASLQAIKDFSRTKKRARTVVKHPEEILEEYLRQIHVNKAELLSLCDPIPTQDDVRRRLIVNLTPQAQRALNEAISERSQRVLRIAANLAKERGHEDQVTEQEITDAIRILEGQTS